MKAAITGATGCIGRNLLEILVQKKWEVIVLHRKGSDLSRLDELDVETMEVDLCREVPRLPHVLDVVFHCAGNVSHWKRDEEQQYIDNVVATQSMVMASVKARVNKFIFTSTGATHQLQDYSLIAQDKFFVPYIRTKKQAERVVLESSLNSVILSPTICIGKYDWNNYSGIYNYIIKGGSLVFPNYMHFCHAKDVADAHLSAYYKGRNGSNYILTGPKVTWLEFFQEAARQLGVPQPTRVTPQWMLKLIAANMEAVSAFTGKTPLLTKEFLYLLRNYDFPSYEILKTSATLEYLSSDLDVMIADSIGWMRSENLLEE